LVKLLQYFRVERSVFIDEQFHSRGNFLYLTEKGAYEYAVNGNTYPVAELDCVIYKKGSFYERRVLRPAVLHLFEIDNIFTDCDAPVTFRNRQRIHSDIALLNSVNAADPANLPYIEHLLNDILYTQLQEKTSRTQPYDARITCALELIRSQFHKGITVTEIAQTVHLSYPHFNRLFTKQLGTTPIGYISALRLDRAKELLYTTDLPIKAVASECGFRDIYYFSNFFKAATGVSPSQFRSG